MTPLAPQHQPILKTIRGRTAWTSSMFAQDQCCCEHVEKGTSFSLLSFPGTFILYLSFPGLATLPNGDWLWGCEREKRTSVHSGIRRGKIFGAVWPAFFFFFFLTCSSIPLNSPSLPWKGKKKSLLFFYCFSELYSFCSFGNKGVFSWGRTSPIYLQILAASFCTVTVYGAILF